MSLKSVLSGRDETLQEVYLAAESRYRKGCFLLDGGQWDGGIYLLGYVAEILLKLAYCRLDPDIELDQLMEARLSVARVR